MPARGNFLTARGTRRIRAYFMRNLMALVDELVPPGIQHHIRSSELVLVIDYQAPHKQPEYRAFPPPLSLSLSLSLSLVRSLARSLARACVYVKKNGRNNAATSRVIVLAENLF